MESIGYDSKQKRSSELEKKLRIQYLVPSSESKEITAAARGTFGFRNRYLAKYQVVRTIRRLRRVVTV